MGFRQNSLSATDGSAKCVDVLAIYINALTIEDVEETWGSVACLVAGAVYPILPGESG